MPLPAGVARFGRPSMTLPARRRRARSSDPGEQPQCRRRPSRADADAAADVAGDPRPIVAAAPNDKETTGEP